jgi:adenylosuccinate synthase
MINGVTQIVMTKADVLDAFEELNVCETYRINGKDQAMVPYQMMKTKIDPQYKSFPGWQTDITKIKSFENLPRQMKEYIAHINQFLGVPVKYISNGPGRDQIILSQGE